MGAFTGKLAPLSIGVKMTEEVQFRPHRLSLATHSRTILPRQASQPRRERTQMMSVRSLRTSQMDQLELLLITQKPWTVLHLLYLPLGQKRHVRITESQQTSSDTTSNRGRRQGTRSWKLSIQPTPVAKDLKNKINEFFFRPSSRQASLYSGAFHR